MCTSQKKNNASNCSIYTSSCLIKYKGTRINLTSVYPVPRLCLCQFAILFLFKIRWRKENKQLALIWTGFIVRPKCFVGMPKTTNSIWVYSAHSQLVPLQHFSIVKGLWSRETGGAGDIGQVTELYSHLCSVILHAIGGLYGFQNRIEHNKSQKNNFVQWKYFFFLLKILYVAADCCRCFYVASFAMRNGCKRATTTRVFTEMFFFCFFCVLSCFQTVFPLRALTTATVFPYRARNPSRSAAHSLVSLFLSLFSLCLAESHTTSHLTNLCF